MIVTSVSGARVASSRMVRRYFSPPPRTCRYGAWKATRARLVGDLMVVASHLAGAVQRPLPTGLTIRLSGSRDCRLSASPRCSDAPCLVPARLPTPAAGGGWSEPARRAHSVAVGVVAGGAFGNRILSGSRRLPRARSARADTSNLAPSSTSTEQRLGGRTTRAARPDSMSTTLGPGLPSQKVSGLWEV